MTVNVIIELTEDLPIPPVHGCQAGKVFSAKYRCTRIDDNGVEVRANERGSSVEFIGDDGSTCVAFSNEYKVVG